MISERINKIHQDMIASASSCGRDVSDITLIGVTKTKPMTMVKEAFRAGLCDFGENYVEEFSSKESEFHPQKLNYHFIGRLPTKKVTKVVGFSSLIHSVGSLKLAKKIDFVASEKNLCQDVLVQINQGSESSKSGILASESFAFFEEVLEYKNINILGLMSIPPFTEPARPYFVHLRELRESLESQFKKELPYLSMGMSNDFQDAIIEGSTHVRLGTTIFGSR